MKIYIEKVIQNILGLLGVIYDIRIVNKITRIHSYLYPILLSRQFKKMGTHCSIGGFSFLSHPQYAIIGDNVTIGKNVVLELNDEWGEGEKILSIFPNRRP